MCRVVDLRQAVLARNDHSARALREELAARGTVVVNMLSSPGSGKTALLEAELGLARRRGVPVAALTADLATENDATRLARSGAPVRQVLTDGLCHLEADMLGAHLDGWLPDPTELLFVENVGNLVCPASYDLGETLRVVLASVTEGEDKPLKYPTAFGLAHLVVVTKHDLAGPAEFDRPAFLAAVRQVNPGVEVVFSSARTGEGVGLLLERALSARDGAPLHQPVMSRQAIGHQHAHVHHQQGGDEGEHDGGHDHDHRHDDAHDHDHGHDDAHDRHHDHGHAHRHDHGHAPGRPAGQGDGPEEFRPGGTAPVPRDLPPLVPDETAASDRPQAAEVGLGGS